MAKERDVFMIGHDQMLELKRWNTPTIYNGWEQITSHDIAVDGFNMEEARDFMPQMGPMVGRAITVVVEPSNPVHRKENPQAWSEYRAYVASVDGPKVVVVQDLDKPRVIGAFWGEVNAGMHRAFGCVGTVIDGAIRDVDEMTDAGLKAVARRLCVGHAWSRPVRWGGEVEVFGRRVEPGRLIHADKHGFLVIPEEDEDRLVEAARLMDANECRTVIAAARSSAGQSQDQMLRNFAEAAARFDENVKKAFGGQGEW